MTNIEYFIKLVNDFKLKVFENGNVRNKLTGQFVEYWSDIYKEYMISNYDVNLKQHFYIEVKTLVYIVYCNMGQPIKDSDIILRYNNCIQDNDYTNLYIKKNSNIKIIPKIELNSIILSEKNITDIQYDFYHNNLNKKSLSDKYKLPYTKIIKAIYG